jgi:hypothetical protein
MRHLVVDYHANQNCGVKGCASADQAAARFGIGVFSFRIIQI